MAFPSAGYTARGGVGMVIAYSEAVALRDGGDDPDPNAPGSAVARFAPVT
jgi:hypothetical protein